MIRVVIPDTVCPPVLLFGHRHREVINPRSNLCGSVQFLCGIILLIHKVCFEVIAQFLTNTRYRFVGNSHVVKTIRIGKYSEQTVAYITICVKADGSILGFHFLDLQRKDGIDESVLLGSVEKLIEFCYHIVGFGFLCGRVLDG